MTNVSPCVIRTPTFPQFSSLFGTMHCPFSHWELVQTSPVHPNPVIRYTLSHINLLISSSKQPPYLPIMAFPYPFRDILPCNFPLFHLLWHTSSVSYCFAWSCSWHRICGKATVHHFLYMSLLIHCPSRYTAGGVHIESYFVLVSSCNHWVVNK